MKLTLCPHGGTLRFVLGLCLMLFVSACSSADISNKAANGTPTAASISLPTLQKILADQPPAAKKAIGGIPLPANQVLPLTFNLPYNEAAFAKDIAQIYTPGSANFHHYLTQDQVVQRYAISDAQLQQVQDWLKQQGYQVNMIDALRSSIQVQASVEVIQRSLKIQLRSYDLLGTKFFMQEGTPTLPTSIDPFVQSIVGLDNFAILQPATTAQRNTKLDGNCTGYTTGQHLTRDKLAAAYQLDQFYRYKVQGQSMSIGVIEMNEPYDPADVANYAACVGIPTPKVETVEVDGHVQPGPGESEAAMDVELIAGLAPQAQIFVYQAGNRTVQAMLDLFNRVAMDRRVQILSVSWGIDESVLSTSQMEAINRSLRTLAAEGVSVFISSGDCGAYQSRVHNLAAVWFPASSPYAIAVGGTSLRVDDQNARTSETAWGKDDFTPSCHNQWGSGGGVSQNRAFERPAWQVGPGTNNRYDGTSAAVFIEGTVPLKPVSAPNGLRQLPDISAAADNIAVYYRGSWILSGGTSASAPILAAGTALIDQALNTQGKPVLGGVPTFYTLANHPRSFHPYNDVVQGNNLFYPATDGWDYATGWGSLNFNEMLQLELAD